MKEDTEEEERSMWGIRNMGLYGAGSPCDMGTTSW